MYSLIFLLSFILFSTCTTDKFEFEKKRFTQSISGQFSPKATPTVGTNYTFATIGDIHISHSADNKITKSFFDTLKTDPVDFVVSLGDITNTGKEDQYKVFNTLLQDSGIQYFFAVIGNHDIMFNGWDRFKQYFGPSVYHFKLQSESYIILDSGNSTISNDQFNWLEARLIESSSQNIFVFTHIPIYVGESSNIFTLDNTMEVARFHHLMKKYHVRFVFSGHFHVYKVLHVDNITYIISGGGTTTQDKSGPHYVKVLINNGNIGFEKIKISY